MAPTGLEETWFFGFCHQKTKQKQNSTNFFLKFQNIETKFGFFHPCALSVATFFNTIHLLSVLLYPSLYPILSRTSSNPSLY
jgi:hypothetical protein